MRRKPGAHGSATTTGLTKTGITVLWLLRFGAILLLVAFELWQMGRFPFQKACSLEQEDFTSDFADKQFGSLLPTIVNWRFHAEPLSRVVVVSFPGHLGCAGRSYLGRLLGILQNDGARVVVVDKYYDSQSFHCGADDTKNLDNRALTDGIKKMRVPVIFGQATESNTHLNSQACSCLVLRKKPDFLTDIPTLKWGLTRIGRDPMQIPIKWSVFSDDTAAATHRCSGDNGKTGVVIDSISLLAVKQIDPEIETRRLTGFSEESFPYTSYVHNPPQVAAVDLETELPTGPNATKIRDQIVVVGEELPEQDEKSFPGGKKYGVQLQANYIESLLDGRFLKPINELYDLLLLVCLLILLHFLNAATEESWVRRLGYSLLALLLLFVGSVLLMMVFNFFPPLRTVLAVTLNPFILASCVLGEDALRRTPKIFKLRESKET